MPRDPIQSAQQMLTHSSEELFLVFPKTIRRIIREELWRDRMDLNGEPFDSFYAFVQHNQWHGLGISYSRLQEYCKDDEQAKRAVAEALPGAADPHSRPGNQSASREHNAGYNIPRDDARGTSSSHTLRRLKRDRPDLADKVISGELSANAAAIEAGFRKKKIQVEPTPESFARAVTNNLDEEQTSRLMALLEA